MTGTTAPVTALTGPSTPVTRYRRPADTFGWFVARRTLRTSAMWAAVAVLYTYLSVVGYFTIGSSAAARQPVLIGFQSNSGLKALIGDTSSIIGIGGYLDWRIVGVISLVTGVWALLTATRWLRGEEVAGRWEQVLAGPTTAGAATGRVLAGLGSGVAAIWLVTSIGAVAIGAGHDVATGVGAAALLGLTLAASPAMFLAVGALASQLMATRARAGALSALVFGVAFMLRALGDVAPAAHWLVYVSPLGWVEQIHPLDGPRPFWLLAVAAFTAIASALTIWLAGRRDLGASVIADRDMAPAHTMLLGRPTLLALRTGRGSIIGWLSAAFVAAALYGSFAKSAQTAVASSANLSRLTSDIVGQAVARANAQIYAGVVFLLMMALLMAYAVTAVGNIRETEAEGYLDNLLVRRVGRITWLTGRLAIAVSVVVGAGLLSGVGFWIGSATQQASLTVGELVAAGLNACAPAVMLLGIAVAAYGFVPRLTTTIGWAVLAWAFLVQMVGLAMHLNHWLMDTSMLHHITLAPAVSPDWNINATYLILAVLAAVTGAWRFHYRDIQTS
jgi:ABC-2 type transport system permease protein